MKNYFNYFLYISFVFLCVALYRLHYLTIPVFHSAGYLLLSVAALIAGFVAIGFVWWQFFMASGFPITFFDGVTATGLSVFGKYIPGKIWTLLGVAGYLNQRYQYPISELTIVTIKVQFCLLWSGLFLGAYGLFLIGGLHVWGIVILVLFTGLSLSLFSNPVNHLAEKMVSWLLRKNLMIPRVTFVQLLKMLPGLFISWLVWVMAFHYLIQSMSEIPVPISTGLGYPLSVALGIIAIFAPGGLGIREGVLVGYLTQAKVPLELATTVSVFARLWFLAGEIGIFFIGFIIQKVSINKLN